MKTNMFAVYWALFGALIFASSASSVPPYRLTHDDGPTETFDWTKIPSARELQYHKCYGSFECARLEVPLDWSNLSNPNFVAIAVARLPAVVDVADESFGGTIVINPGGPGGSGVGILLWGGKGVQKIVDSDKHFEILSFDPRGMQFSTPSLACFQDNDARDSLARVAVDAGSLESNQYGMDVKWSIDEALGRLCEHTCQGVFPDGSTIRQFVSTALVAHDMVEIVDQVDAHLQEQLDSRSNRLHQQQTTFSAGSRNSPPLLNYWGLSYGTYLGNTFASMFPERVGRVVLDGVVDADDYTATGWTSNLQDNNKTWAKFFEYCFEAGSKCALFDPSVSEPRDIQFKAETFLEELRNNPIPLLRNGNAYVLTSYHMKYLIHAYSYSPIQLWPLLALTLAFLMQKDLSGAMSALRSAEAGRHLGFAPSPPLRHSFPMISNSYADSDLPIGYPWQLEAGVSVLCGDGEDINYRSKADFSEYLALLESQSPLVGSIWAEIILHCIHWPASNRPSLQNRFTGPFQSNLSDYDPRGSPLLFIGNTEDPVTPVRNAFKMSERHEGSVVLTQDTPGHCSGTNNPSVCTFGVLKDFFGNGTLPKPGLVCEGALKPWRD